MSKTSPTSRTVEALRAEGWTCEVVERWLPRCRIRRDLFHCGDVLAVKPGAGVLMVQATSDDHVAHRIAKSRALPELRAFLAAGSCRFEVWGWSRRNGKWRVRRVELRGEDLLAADLTPRPRRRKRQRSLFDSLPTLNGEKK